MGIMVIVIFMRVEDDKIIKVILIKVKRIIIKVIESNIT